MARDSGHKRVPDPPDNTIGNMAAIEAYLDAERARN
jgi:hypothetical protein